MKSRQISCDLLVCLAVVADFSNRTGVGILTIAIAIVVVALLIVATIMLGRKLN